MALAAPVRCGFCTRRYARLGFISDRRDPRHTTVHVRFAPKAPLTADARVDDFDFDITVQRFGFSTTPGDSLRTFFSSQAAGMRGSQNLAGMSDPVIDALIDKIIAANSRTSLTTACRAR